MKLFNIFSRTWKVTECVSVTFSFQSGVFTTSSITQRFTKAKKWQINYYKKFFFESSLSKYHDENAQIRIKKLTQV